MFAVELHAHSKHSADGRGTVEQLILAAIREGETTVQGRRTPYRITLRQAADSATRQARELF